MAPFSLSPLSCALSWLLTLLAAVARADTSHDYVIIGGGVSGLLLANRLSADPAVSVALLEPGTDQRDNPRVTDPTRVFETIQSPVDWTYHSVPQPQLGNHQLLFSAGKGLGGSSLINGMVYIRADAAQIDAWEQLGNPGWNWSALQPYYKSLETFFPPDLRQTGAGASYVASDHGTSGPVRVGFNPAITGGSFFGVVKSAWASLGIPSVKDFNGGSTRGFSAHQQTLDPTQSKRWDAATAFYWPVSSRENLHLYSGSGTRIVWNTGSSPLVATGVIHHPNGGQASATINARKEVIICAGALRTPLILEQSGIGNATYLQGLGISPQVDLPGVGEGLNDQPDNGINYKSKFTEVNYTAHASFVNAHDLFGDDFDAVAQSSRNGLTQWADQLSGGNSATAAALQTLFRIQHELMFKANVTTGEILTTISSGSVGVRYWETVPFSRGSVHLRSNGDFQVPKIDAGFFSIGFDSVMQTAIGRLAARVWTTDPASRYVSGRVSPSTSTLPDGATAAQWGSFHRSTAGSISHPIGTAAMRRRDLLGVVDPRLVVYGTSNVRVVDASILPTQLSGHLTATCYAIAQRASEMIIGG